MHPPKNLCVENIYGKINVDTRLSAKPHTGTTRWKFMGFLQSSENLTNI